MVYDNLMKSKFKITKDTKVLLVYFLVFLPIFCGLYIWYTNSHTEVVATQAIVSVAPAPQPPTKSELLRLVNAERSKNNVAPLVEDLRLDQSAQRKADEMTKDNNNSHIDPNGVHGYTYINDVGIYCKTDGENLYWGYTNEYKNTSKGAVDWWISSKPHHEAMIDSNYSLTGFGISGYRIVEHFCQQ